jgi:hypothetical protein
LSSTTSDDYWKLSELEQHLFDAQAGVRRLASTWILGALAAIGFVIKPVLEMGSDFKIEFLTTFNAVNYGV